MAKKKLHRDPDFKEDMDRVWATLKRFPGGKTRFFKEFPKKSYLIRHWRKGEIIARPEDKLIFFETAEKVLSEMEKEYLESEVYQKLQAARENLKLT